MLNRMKIHSGQTGYDLTETKSLVSSLGVYNKARFCARRMKESALKYKCPPPADVAIIAPWKLSQHLGRHTVKLILQGLDYLEKDFHNMDQYPIIKCYSLYSPSATRHSW